MRLLLALLLTAATVGVPFQLAGWGVASAQWQLQDSRTTADLRGIDNVVGGVAWASGSDGAILRTEDAGFVWQLCAKPPGGEHLDFRAIQAFDNNTAIVMSSGKGSLSRLYKTTDGCQTWKLLFTNPDKDGFWDNLFYDTDDDRTFILGDPVNGQFQLFWADEDEQLHMSWNGHTIRATKGEAAFAASNSLFAMNVGDGAFSFITGGSMSEVIHEEHGISANPKIGLFSGWYRTRLPFPACDSCGAFSMAAGPYDKATKRKTVVVVGGDYKKPDKKESTAAYSFDWGDTFHLSHTPPHGYRSAVAYDSKSKTWITVGPNGTDISTDDGRNWRALKPNPALNDPPDDDQHWNALSLPYAVGPQGRIGTLRPAALKPSK
jgi:photosystem II stability/assembly factor-like uncharacterized protein